MKNVNIIANNPWTLYAKTKFAKSSIYFNKGNASNEVSSNKMYLIIHEKKLCVFIAKTKV